MTGRYLLVGGSGGLGYATARRLASEGAELVVSFVTNEQRAQKLQDVARLIQADITISEDRTRLLAEAGPVEGLVVFSGNPARVTSPDQVELKMHESHEINYLGPVLLAREVADRMRAGGTPGSIVLFSTMQGVALFAGSSVYAGAKAALIHSARILAKEMRSDNIRVNVIAPGVMNAGMAEASIASGKYETYLQQKIIPRYGRAEDIAAAVCFFLRPDNYVTGQVLSVDGGITL